MKRLRSTAMFLVPVSIFVIACIKSYLAPSQYWGMAASPNGDWLLRRPAQVIVALVAMFAPLPLSAAASRAVRRRQQAADPVALLGTQLLALVVVELVVFFGLVALGAVTTGAFLAAHGVVALAGLAAAGAFGPRRVRTPEGAAASRRFIRTYLLMIMTLACCGLASVHFGRDAGYDFYNYHYYNAYSFLNGRDRVDFALADIVTHLNPMLDVAYYLVIRSVRPIWVGFIAGSVHGVAVVLLYAIAHEVLGQTGALRDARVPLAGACAVAGACEPVFLGQLGTTFHDNLLASFVLAALLLVLRLVGRAGEVGAGRAWPVAAWAGALIGLATGFKLTTAIYAVALAPVLLATPRGWKPRLALVSAFGAAALAGFLASNGHWMAHLHANYRSPLFPLYNAIFKSPYYPDTNISYLTNTSGFRWYDHLLLPFYLAANNKLVSETPLSDLRPAVVFGLLILVVVGRSVGLLRRAAWRPRSGLREVVAGPLPPAAVLLIVFSVASYVIWYLQFRVLRYLVALKVLLPLVSVLLVLDLCRSGRRVVIASWILLALVVAIFDVPSWGRAHWKKFDYLGYRIPPIEGVDNGIVLMNASTDDGGFLSPVAAVTTQLPPGLRYVRMDSQEVGNPFGGKPLAMEQEVTRLLRDHDGPVFLLTHTDPSALARSSRDMKRYHLAIADGQEPTRIDGWCADLGLWNLERTDGAVGGVAAAPDGPLSR